MMQINFIISASLTFGRCARINCGGGGRRLVRLFVAMCAFSMAIQFSCSPVEAKKGALVLVHVIKFNARKAGNWIRYTSTAKILYSEDPTLQSLRIIKLRSERMVSWLGMPPFFEPVALRGTNLLVWVRSGATGWQWQQPPRGELPVLKIGLARLPSPVARRDVAPLIVALDALKSRRKMLADIRSLSAAVHRKPGAHRERYNQRTANGAAASRTLPKLTIKAAGDAKKLLGSSNYYLWALGAYETVRWGSRRKAAALLETLLETKGPDAPMAKKLMASAEMRTNCPVLSLRRATWLFYLFTDGRVRAGNHIPEKLAIREFLKFLTTYESAAKQLYVPASSALPRLNLLKTRSSRIQVSRTWQAASTIP